MAMIDSDVIARVIGQELKAWENIPAHKIWSSERTAHRRSVVGMIGDIAASAYFKDHEKGRRRFLRSCGLTLAEVNQVRENARAGTAAGA